MNKIKAIILLTLAALTTTACMNSTALESDAAGTMNSVTVKGSTTYRERIQAPPGAKVHVHLNDISMPNSAPKTLAQQVIDLSGRSVPVNYTLRVPKNRLKPGGSYAIRTVIRDADNRLLWTSEGNTPVNLNQDMQELPTIIMLRADSNINTGNTSPGLAGKTWNIVTIDGAPVLDRTKPFITFDTNGRVSGMAGCNNFSGDYTANNNTLKFQPLAVTAKACIPDVDRQEIKLLEVLNAVNRYTIDATGRLTLTASNGRQIRAAMAR